MGSDLLGAIRREIEDRLAGLWPAVQEYERLLAAAEAVELERRAANGADGDAGGRRGPGRGGGGGGRGRGGGGDAALREAILGSLEHGSHTVAELTVVTGAGAAQVNRELRQLDAAGLVAKAEREGKPAWSLASLATGD